MKDEPSDALLSSLYRHDKLWLYGVFAECKESFCLHGVETGTHLMLLRVKTTEVVEELNEKMQNFKEKM